MHSRDKRQSQRKDLDADRPHFFSAFADGNLEDCAVMRADDELLEQNIAQSTCKIQQAVNSDRQHCEQGFADPAGCYRLERKNKEVKKVAHNILPSTEPATCRRWW